jgi:hypothetical protein
VALRTPDAAAVLQTTQPTYIISPAIHLYDSAQLMQMPLIRCFAHACANLPQSTNRLQGIRITSESMQDVCCSASVSVQMRGQAGAGDHRKSWGQESQGPAPLAGKATQFVHIISGVNARCDSRT